MASFQDDRGLNGDYHDRGTCKLCLEMEQLQKVKEQRQISTGDGLLFTRNCNFAGEGYSIRTQEFTSRMGNAADRTASTELNWKNTTRAYLNRFLGKYRNTGEPKSTFGNGRGSTNSYFVSAA